jgi:type III pantothenate kinase
LEAAVWRKLGLDEIFHKKWGNTSVGRVIACNVAGSELETAFASWCRNQWRVDPEMLRASEQCAGLVSGYLHPHELGDDRWAAMIGAHHLTSGAVCIIDFGTAVTLDLVARDGRHLGGVIIPGLATMRRSLRAAAHHLSVKLEGSGLPAKSTGGAIAAGTRYGLVGAVERIVFEFEKQVDEPLSTLLTGGDAAELQPLFRVHCSHEPGLVLHGLAVAAGLAQ